jgi:hypothetical protein
MKVHGNAPAVVVASIQASLHAIFFISSIDRLTGRRVIATESELVLVRASINSAGHLTAG